MGLGGCERICQAEFCFSLRENGLVKEAELWLSGMELSNARDSLLECEAVVSRWRWEGRSLKVWRHARHTFHSCP